MPSNRYFGVVSSSKGKNRLANGQWFFCVTSLHTNWRKIFKFCSLTDASIPIHLTVTFARQSVDLETIKVFSRNNRSPKSRRITSVQNNLKTKFFRRALGSYSKLVRGASPLRKIFHAFRTQSSFSDNVFIK